MFSLCSNHPKGNPRSEAAYKEYIVVPFVFAREGTLTPGRPCSLEDPERAKRAAAALELASAGVIVLEQAGDDESEVFDEPRLIYHAGIVPEEMFQFT